MTFTPDVYEQIREGAKRSAAVVVPMVCELVAPHFVVDVGCGEGWFAREFAATHGCRVLALDGSAEDRDEMFGPDAGVRFERADLRYPPFIEPGHSVNDIASSWDLAVCLEVVEHLDELSGRQLIWWLCDLSDVVLFSAAVPGQGGHGHVNEQWPGYWADLFIAEGFAARDCFRRALWEDDRVEPWYRQNLLLFARFGHPVLGASFPAAAAYSAETIRPLPLVHPVVWEHRRQKP